MCVMVKSMGVGVKQNCDRLVDREQVVVGTGWVRGRGEGTE